MTRIEKDYVFEAAVHFNGRFVVNTFNILLSMLVETDSSREQNVAVDRINYFLNQVIENCIFVAESQTEAIEKYENAGIRICRLPEEPFDQVIGAILLIKLNAIMEGRLVITDVEFGSRMSDGITFVIISEEAENAFSGKHWWIRSNTAISDLGLSDTNILNLFDPGDWAKLELTWKEKGKPVSP